MSYFLNKIFKLSPIICNLLLVRIWPILLSKLVFFPSFWMIFIKFYLKVWKFSLSTIQKIIYTFLLMFAKCVKILDIFWSSTVSHSMATTLLLISKVDIMNVSKIWFVRQRSKESNIFAWHNNICFTVFLSKVFGLSWSCFCLALAV